MAEEVELGHCDLPLPEREVGRAEAPVVAKKAGPKGLLSLQLPLGLSPGSKPSWEGRRERGLRGEGGDFGPLRH